MLWLVLLLAVPVVSLAAFWLVGERGHLLLPSTRAAITQRQASAKSGRTGILNGLHGYVYGRWPYQYIKYAIRWVLPHLRSEQLRRWWADHYHGKVLTTDLACAIITLDHDIPRTDLDQVIPYPVARDIVLDGPPNVTLLECPCRLARESPCRPTQVCMLVGGGDFALEHHPDRTRRVSQREAVALLQAEHQRGHVHTAYFKDAAGHKFYAICNCCRCCCGGLEAMLANGVPMVASSGFVAEVDEAGCIGCGDCETVCPFTAMRVPYRAEVEWARCMGCGVCVGCCPTDAVSLVRDERKGLPLDVRVLPAPLVGRGVFP